MKSKPTYKPEIETEYRDARSSEQMRIADNLHELYDAAGVLLVDAEGHGIISAKIASTVHDTFHAFMLAELDRWGKTTPELFERINLRLAQSATARNALGRSGEEYAREVATMLYGEVHPSGHFRFVNFGHPPPLLFSSGFGKFLDIDKSRMVQFLPLGLEIPENHPDRNHYFSMHFRQRRANSSDVAELTLVRPGDALFLYTDGVYDGSDRDDREKLESLMRKHCRLPAKEICKALLEYALEKDDQLKKTHEEDRIDDKTVFVIRRI
jgi:serine phosphatase RsbU (regulator of sigma subunit)